MSNSDQYQWYENCESYERLVRDIRLINHMWHSLDTLENCDALREELRALKDLRQLHLIREHSDKIKLEISTNKPGMYLINLRVPVSGHKDAAHIPIKKVSVSV